MGARDAADAPFDIRPDEDRSDVVITLSDTLAGV